MITDITTPLAIESLYDDLLALVRADFADRTEALLPDTWEFAGIEIVRDVAALDMSSETPAPVINFTLGRGDNTGKGVDIAEQYDAVILIDSYGVGKSTLDEEGEVIETASEAAGVQARRLMRIVWRIINSAGNEFDEESYSYQGTTAFDFFPQAAEVASDYRAFVARLELKFRLLQAAEELSGSACEGVDVAITASGASTAISISTGE
jgi:hypothetical protein